MADSELGELRRPPRLLEHRIERLSRHRGFGLAGGSSDALLPVDATDDVLAGAGGDDGGGEVAAPEWYHDTLTLTSTSLSTRSLTHEPIEHSEVIRLNGITLAVNVDYTIAGNIVTFLDLTNLRKGIGSATWTIDANYAFYESTSFSSPAFSDWVLNGSAALSGGWVYLTNTTNQAGSMVAGPIPEGWVTIKFLATINLTADADGIAIALLDPDLFTTAWVGAGADDQGFTNGVGWPGCGHAELVASTYWSHDTRFKSRNSANSAGTNEDLGFIVDNNADVDHAYEVTFTATTAGRASGQLKIDGAVMGTTTTDLYVPDSALVFLSGGTGLFGGNQIIKAIDVQVTS